METFWCDVCQDDILVVVYREDPLPKYCPRCGTPFSPPPNVVDMEVLPLHERELEDLVEQG